MNKSIVLMLVLVFLIASCIVVVKPVWASSASENSWETMASMPTARSGLGVAVVNGKIYAIGGASEGDYNVNEMYDPATNTWTTKQSMPTPRFSLATAAYGNKIYCIGGANTENSGPVPIGSNEAYDPATDTWREMKSMPTPRYQMQANVVEGKIYLIGGSSGAPTFQWFSVNEVYDPASDTWTTKKPMPTAVWGYASVVIDSKIYIMGGSGNGTLLQVYDSKTDTWRYGASLPIRVAGAGAVATSGVWAPEIIYVIGATDGMVSYDFNLVYDPKTDSWSTGASMPTARGYLGVAVVDDVLYVIGGTGWNYLEPPVSVNEKYTPIGYGTVPPAVYVVFPEENMAYPAGDVSLTFTVNRPVVELSYSLDGGANVSITGNTTLTGLTDGVHNVTVYAADSVGNVGASETVTFTIEPEPFPTTLVIASVISVAVVGAGVLVYFKKRKH